MTANPNPTRITNEMWRLWEETAALTPGIRLGGIYADKPCYHNTVIANKAKWPTGYCIKLPLDLKGPLDKSRAIDWTMSEVEMIKRTGYLKRAADHPFDNRLGAMREFIGTLNGKDVYCLIRNADGIWEFDGGRDATHLWHVHGSIFTFYCNNWEELRKIVSVWSGQTWEEWLQQEDAVTIYFRTESADAAWNNHMYMSDGINRRPVRSPGAIRKKIVSLPGMVEVKLTDADLAAVSTVETWPNYLNAIAGSLVEEFNVTDRAKLDEILAAAKDDGDLTIVLPPEAIAVLEAIRNKVTTLPDTTELRDAVADLGEGGAKQVRADA